jgi:hypothetical protein
MDELKQVLFDVIGDYVNPDTLTIEEKPNGNVWVLSKIRIPEGLQKMAQNDLDKRLEGTKFEDKVNLYWPVN